MALDTTIKPKLVDPFSTTAAPADQQMFAGGTPNFNESGAQPAGLLNSPEPKFNAGSGVFGVQPGAPATTNPTMLNLGDLDRRTVDKPTETVSGQMDSLLAGDSQYMQSARTRAMQTANSRGLLNSTMAATAGEKAAIDAALPIAQVDAGVFGKASDYNTALTNQARMYNADTANNASKQQVAIEADKATATAQQAAQMSIAQLQSETSKYAADKTAGTASNNTRNSLINNILMTTELSPDRKAALLKEMGEPGYASAVYVVESVAPDLAERLQQRIDELENAVQRGPAPAGTHWEGNNLMWDNGGGSANRLLSSD